MSIDRYEKAKAKYVESYRQYMAAKKKYSLEDYAAKLLRKGLKPDGSPVLDPTPMAPPIGYRKHPSMVEMVRDMVRSERLAMEARAAGAESFEESEDFAVDDEYEMHSEYENDFDPPIDEVKKAVEEDRVAREEAVVKPVSPDPASKVPPDPESEE